MIKKIPFYFSLIALSAPLLVTAQLGSGSSAGLSSLINTLSNILRDIIPIIFGLALVGFFWGVAMYIFNADDATKRKEGSRMMLYGIISLFVMVSVWGLVGLISGVFGFNVHVLPTLPGGGF